MTKTNKLRQLTFWLRVGLSFFYLSAANGQGIYQLWGATTNGGPDDLGVFFSNKYDGTNQAVKKFFTAANPGLPYGNNKPVVFNNKLYAVLNGGGVNDAGIICEYDPATNNYAKKGDLFTIGGSKSTSSLTVYNNKLYGTCQLGGLNNTGILFEYNPANNILTKQIDFALITGTQPNGQLVVFNNKMYGITMTGGANNIGVIFEYDPQLNNYTKKIDFVSNTTGGTALSGLTVYGGKLWGVTSEGNGAATDGTIFSYDPLTNIISPKKSFLSINAKNVGGNLIVLNNKFYAIAGLGGANDKGLIFEFNPANNVLVNKFNFNNNTANGNCELGVYNNLLFGVSTFGSINNEADEGVIFSYNPAANIYTSKIYLNKNIGTQAIGGHCMYNNKIYSFTMHGAAHGKGCLFEYDPAANEYTKKIDLGSADLFSPNGKPIYYDNKIFGTASLGGTNQHGGIYAYDIETGAFSTKINMLAQDAGYSDNSAYIILSGKKFYGVSTKGGANGGGILFEYDPLQNSYVKKYDFTQATGIKPAGLLTEMNGKLYGMCSQGGANNMGTIYVYDIAMNVVTKKIDLDNNLGKYSSTGFVALNNKLYATLPSGGANGFGTVIVYDPENNSCIKKADFNKIMTGGRPYGGLRVCNNKLYGLSYIGGANDEGTLYEFDPLLSSLTKKIDLSKTMGMWPLSKMTLLNDKLYGMTSYGGSLPEGGVLFEYDSKSNNYVKKIDFTAVNGKYPGSSELATAPAPTAHGNLGFCANANAAFIDAQNNNQWVAFTNATGEAVAEINANGNNLGNVVVNYYVHNGPTRMDGNGRFYLNRNITFHVQNPPASPVSVRLYIRKTEFESLKNTPGSGVFVPGDMTVFKNEDNCSSQLIASAVKINSTESPWGFDYVYSAEVNDFSSFYFGSKAYQVLPIKLLSFTGEAGDKANKLEWKGSCTNAIDFDIERSSDGIHFSNIGTIKATQQDCDNPFTFIDENPISGKNYYRLKMVENGDPGKYSAVLTLNRSGNSFLTVAFYPNPVQGNVAKIKITSSQPQIVQLIITDMQGRQVMVRGFDAIQGVTEETLDVSRLSSGTYQVVYNSGGKPMVTRFVKK